MNTIQSTKPSLTAMCEHVVAVYHYFLKDQVPRMRELVEQVTWTFEVQNPNLKELRLKFEQLCQMLTEHLKKEEDILFPYYGQLDQVDDSPFIHSGPHRQTFGIEQPITVMEQEHANMLQLLADIRHLANDYELSDWADLTYLAMLQELQAIESDLQKAIQQENDVLFPQALAQAAEKSYFFAPAL